MLTALWHLSAAVRGYLRFYMPTNRAVDWLRTPEASSGRSLSPSLRRLPTSA